VTIKSSLPYQPRLTVEITQEQLDGLRKHLPWGTQKAVMGALIDELIYVCETHGTTFIAAILAGAIKPREIMPILDPDKETA